MLKVGAEGAVESLVIITAVDPEDSLSAVSVAVAVKVFVHSDNDTLIQNGPDQGPAIPLAIIVTQL